MDVRFDTPTTTTPPSRPPPATIGTGPAPRSTLTRPLKAGIIGLGVGEQHIAGYARHRDCEILLLCDISAAKRDQVARRHPGLRIVAAPELSKDNAYAQFAGRSLSSFPWYA